MKPIVVFSVSQTRVTHLPAIIFETTYEDLCKVDKKYKDSIALKMHFENPLMKTIYLMMYETSEGELRRSVGGSSNEDSKEEMRDVMSMLAKRVGINLTFHSDEEFKKIIPHNKADRELLKAFFRS